MDKKTIYTNQYAATSQSHSVPERAVSGIFFNFDIEPILLTVRAEKDSFLRAMVRIVNVDQWCARWWWKVLSAFWMV